MPARGPFVFEKMSRKLDNMKRALKDGERSLKRRRLSLGGVYTHNSGAGRAATDGLAPKPKSDL